MIATIQEKGEVFLSTLHKELIFNKNFALSFKMMAQIQQKQAFWTTKGTEHRAQSITI